MEFAAYLLVGLATGALAAWLFNRETRRQLAEVSRSRETTLAELREESSRRASFEALASGIPELQKEIEARSLAIAQQSRTILEVTNEKEALAATLPHPRSSNPAFRPGRMLARRDLILARYHGADVVIPSLDDLDLDIPLDSLPVIPVIPPVIPPLESLRVELPVPVDTPPDDTGGSEASGIRDTRRPQDAEWLSGARPRRLLPVNRRDAEA